MRVALVLLALAAACTPAAPPKERAPHAGDLWGERRPEACRLVLNRPVSGRLLAITQDGGVREIAPCADARCMLASRDVVVLPIADDGGRSEARFTDGTVRRLSKPPRASPFVAHFTLSGDTLLTRDDDGALVLLAKDAARDRRIAAPHLPPRARPTAHLVTDDALFVRLLRREERGDGARPRSVDLWHVVRDDGAHQIERPVSDGASLCGSIRTEGADITFTHVDGRAVTLDSRNRRLRSPLVACDATHVTISSTKPSFLARIDRETLAVRRVDATVAEHLFSFNGRVLGFHPELGIVEKGAAGDVPVWPRAALRDLAGAPWPPQSSLEHVSYALGDARLLVIERFRTTTCELIDRVHLVDLDGATAMTVRDGHGLRVAPLFGAGTYYVVEADQETSTVE